MSNTSHFGGPDGGDGGKGGGVIPVYQAERMEVSGQGGMRVIEKPWIAISQEALSQKGEYQMLLNEKYWL